MPTKPPAESLKLYLPGSFSDGRAQRHLQTVPHPLLASFQLLMRVQLPLFDAGVFVGEYENRTHAREDRVLDDVGDYI